MSTGDITKEIEESEEIVAQIINCQMQIKESKKSGDPQQVLPVFAPPSAVYVQHNQQNTSLQMKFGKLMSFSTP